MQRLIFQSGIFSARPLTARGGANLLLGLLARRHTLDLCRHDRDRGRIGVDLSGEVEKCRETAIKMERLRVLPPLG